MSDSQNDKEKKGGAVPPWMTQAANVGKSGMSSSSLLGAGSGAGKLGLLGRLTAALAAPKAVVALTVLGGLALGGGIVFNNSDSGGKLKGGIHARPGASRPVSASASGSLPGGIEETPSALRLAQQANTGALGIPVDPDESADAVADGEYEDGEWAEEEGDEVAEAGDAAGGEEGGTDEMAAAMTRGGGAAKAGLGRKFGKLSSGVGGGGGTSASLSIGNLRKGASPKGAKMGQSRALSRGQKAAVSRGKSASRNRSKGGLRGATAKRLQEMSGAMGQGGRNAEATAAEHSRQWDNAPGAGNSLQGSGGTGVGGGSGDFGSTQGNGSGLPDDTKSGDRTCPEGFSGTPPNCQADDADTNGGQNLTPYQGMVDMAIALMVISSIFIALGSWLATLAKTPATSALYAAAFMLCKIGAALAGIVAMIGLAIMGMHGQMVQGGIFATVGTLEAILAWGALAKPSEAGTTQLALKNVAAPLVASALGLLGAVGGANTGAETDENGNIKND